MCRRTAQAVIQDLGENGRMKIFNQVKKILFGSDADAWPSMPEIGPFEGGVLLELLKDMLYEAYVRKGRLQQAMMVRRFFAEESLPKITTIGRATGSD